MKTIWEEHIIWYNHCFSPQWKVYCLVFFIIVVIGNFNKNRWTCVRFHLDHLSLDFLGLDCWWFGILTVLAAAAAVLAAAAVVVIIIGRALGRHIAQSCGGAGVSATGISSTTSCWWLLQWRALNCGPTIATRSCCKRWWEQGSIIIIIIQTWRGLQFLWPSSCCWCIAWPPGKWKRIWCCTACVLTCSLGRMRIPPLALWLLGHQGGWSEGDVEILTLYGLWVECEDLLVRVTVCHDTGMVGIVGASSHWLLKTLAEKTTFSVPHFQKRKPFVWI